MSDSDDTDILLLIPPNYFLATAERKLIEQKMAHDAAGAVPTTSVYKYLPPSKKSELNQINARLQNIASKEEDDGAAAAADYHFVAPSDISTISTSTVRTQLGNRKVREIHGLVHSTPKNGLLQNNNGPPAKRNAGCADDGILLEIDNYLDEHHQYNGCNWQHHHSDEYRPEREQNFGSVGAQTVQTNSLPTALNRLTLNKPPVPTLNSGAESQKLISLGEIWSKGGQTSSVSMAAPMHSTLQEEHFRRQHLEKTVHTLQTQLLEYEQRISVAIEVDRTKDAALRAAQQENQGLNHEVQHLRDALHKLELDRQDNNERIETLQRELTQAVSLATKFQEKNEKLEMEVTTYSRKANESCSQHKQELEAFELQVASSKRAEECANNELQKLQDKYAKMGYQNEKLRSRSEELEKECTTLRHQKEMLQEYHQKQKSRADALETQKKTFQETLAKLTENELTLKKKLESQQRTLKSHYQQQLENVVTQKLREFQEQLDKSDECLKAEARERERLIAERAVKQLEMINEKNEQELNLLQEKHNEEVELYRLQLANASKKIDELEAKLNCYKSKRADIAEQLHSVMETQWQKALEILTSPNQTGQLLVNTDTESESPEHNAHEQYRTPKASKTQRSGASNSTEKNNLDMGDKKDPTSPMDKLQAYIELLLSKTPGDFDKLDEILALTSKYKPNAGKQPKRGAKPPWKS